MQFRSGPCLNIRTDRYDRKLMKYYVVYGEEDDAISEDEEECRHETEQAHPLPPCSPRPSTSEPDQAAGEANFEMLGKEAPDSEAEDEENEKEAVVINTPKQETIILKAPYYPLIFNGKVALPRKYGHQSFPPACRSMPSSATSPGAC